MKYIPLLLTLFLTACIGGESSLNTTASGSVSLSSGSTSTKAFQASSVAPPKSQPAATKEGWKTYENTQYHIRFHYPSNWNFALMSGADLHDSHILSSFEVTPPGFLGGPEYFVMVTDRSLQAEVERQSSSILQGGTTEIVSTLQVARYGQQGKQIRFRHKTVGSVYSVYFFTYQGRTYYLRGEETETKNSYAPTVARIAETFQFLAR